MSIIDQAGDLLSRTQRFRHEAMATVYEVFILHDDAHYAHQAAWEAFRLLDRLELELSRFIENSDISRINGLAPGLPQVISLTTFECLELSKRLSAETGGAFDITAGFLLDCWLNKNKSLRSPSDKEVAAARALTGMHLFELDEKRHTVRLVSSPVRIDLGGVGKGYALDRMARLLREWSIDAALLHGGKSSVLAIGSPSDMDGWPLTISRPGRREEILVHLSLRDRALGGSGLEKGQHIIDPRTGRPVTGRVAAWSSAETATAADALSTAFMAMAPEEVSRYCSEHPGAAALVLLDEQAGLKSEDAVLRFGDWEEESSLD